MLKKALEGCCLFLFFVIFIALLSTTITGVGWLITGKTEWKLLERATLIGLYGAFFGILLHAVFYDKMKIGHRLFLALLLLFILLLSLLLQAGNLLFQPEIFPLLALWWMIMAAGFFFLSFAASDDQKTTTKTNFTCADR